MLREIYGQRCSKLSSSLYEPFPQLQNANRPSAQNQCHANVHHFISGGRGLCDKCWRFGSHAAVDILGQHWQYRKNDVLYHDHQQSEDD